MLVFVYGTLKQGYGNNRLLEGARFVDQAETLAPYAMFDVGFPFITRSVDPKGFVTGEVYEIDPDRHLPRLDQLESEGWLYNRVVGWVELLNLHGATKKVSYYEIHPERDHSMQTNAAFVAPDATGRVTWGR